MKHSLISILTMLRLPALLFAQEPAGQRSGNAAGAAAGFVSIFEGKTLSGWDGDPKYWRVENGCLAGEVTTETILKRNSFIIWRGGIPLKQTPCLNPECRRMGWLIGHGHLCGYGEGNEKVMRGQRVLCGNRRGRRGCGQTFSILPCALLRRRQVDAPRLFDFLRECFAACAVVRRGKRWASFFPSARPTACGRRFGTSSFAFANGCAACWRRRRAPPPSRSCNCWSTSRLPSPAMLERPARAVVGRRRSTAKIQINPVLHLTQERPRTDVVIRRDVL